MEEKFCAHCGAPLGKSKYCTECGAKAPEPEKAPDSQLQQMQAQPRQEYPQPEYQQPVYSQPPVRVHPAGPDAGAEVVGIGKWLGMLALCAVPVVNIIALIIWSCVGRKNSSLSNFARAYLIWTAICLVLTLLLTVLFYSVLMPQLTGIWNGLEGIH